MPKVIKVPKAPKEILGSREIKVKMVLLDLLVHLDQQAALLDHKELLEKMAKMAKMARTEKTELMVHREHLADPLVL